MEAGSGKRPEESTRQSRPYGEDFIDERNERTRHLSKQGKGIGVFCFFLISTSRRPNVKAVMSDDGHGLIVTLSLVTYSTQTAFCLAISGGLLKFRTRLCPSPPTPPFFQPNPKQSTPRVSGNPVTLCDLRLSLSSSVSSSLDEVVHALRDLRLDLSGSASSPLDEAVHVLPRRMRRHIFLLALSACFVTKPNFSS